jgi:hypothetical protein
VDKDDADMVEVELPLRGHLSGACGDCTGSALRLPCSIKGAGRGAESSGTSDCRHAVEGGPGSETVYYLADTMPHGDTIDSAVISARPPR